ncbi:PIN domain-containing protein [Chryseobacterium contaminans]|uniref:PIN domain-containing protein n=1 Tax=Chryseobacterium contaminans TaxID=1423959 RepID=UPI00301A04B6
MTNIIIDTNIILRYPQILGLRIPNINFIVPLVVISELNIRAEKRGVSYDPRVDLIEKAIKEGTISIINSDGPILAKYNRILHNNRLSSVDISILASAIEIKNKDQEVKIATLDKVIIDVAQQYNIEVLSRNEILKFLSEFKDEELKTESIENLILNYENKENKIFIKGLFIGIATCLVAVFLYKNIESVISTINIWGTIIIIILFGICLFIFREKQRLSYGFFEFFVGIGAIIILFKPNNFNYQELQFTFDFSLKLMGGLYIMVRGQDNIVKAIKDTKIGIILKDKFGIGI